MQLHQIDIKQTITHEAAKTLAQILISTQGIKTPVVVKVVLPSIEYVALVEQNQVADWGQTGGRL
ncbi:hypothetical protein [Paenibacillus sp. BAC0078]